jgi:prepilin-type N-terminal cleavage/methylation domain-containing protein
MMRSMKESGFTLIETLTALVIFAAVVVAIERGSAIGWRGLRLARLDTGALALARAKIASAGVDVALPDDVDEFGDDPPYHWRLTTRKYVAPEAVAMPARMGAYWVNVTVSWRDRPVGPPRAVALETLKIRVEP